MKSQEKKKSNNNIPMKMMLRIFIIGMMKTDETSAFSYSSMITNNNIRPTTTTTTSKRTIRRISPIDDNFDAVLDQVLGEVYKDVDNGVALSSNKGPTEGSKPVPSKLTEKTQDELDFTDPKTLSVMNPHWVESGLDPRIIDILSEKSITQFTPVQAEAFGPVVAGRDVIGRSRTGTGKTLAFGLPSITRLVTKLKEKGIMNAEGRLRRGRKVSMIVMCPTRELARQVQQEIRQVARPSNLFVEVFHGGVSYNPQTSALRDGLDILVGTPGRVIDHIERGNLNLSECEIVVLDEADEMLKMGFAEDVEVILDGVGSANDDKTQCLMFSATTPSWVKQIGRKYQSDVMTIDATTEESGARTATTVRHLAIQVPHGANSKTSILEDVIAVEISKDTAGDDEKEIDTEDNPIAAAAAEKKKKTNNFMQQKIFGKTIVFTETKRMADELVSGSIFKSLTAQALHGDVGQKQRDATLAAFRKGAFNVLVATDVAARGIDIQNVDLVIQFDPPTDPDTYVHRSGRTGRAGKKGVSVLLFNQRQSRDIVKIERDLGHGFKFELAGPPTIEAALRAAAKTSAMACQGIPDETAEFFREAATKMLEEGEDTLEDIVARCLAAISRRGSSVNSRSLLTGEEGLVTVQMSNENGNRVAARDVMFTVGKLSRLSQKEGEESAFDSDIGKIQSNADSSTAIFDMGVEDAKRLVEFSKDIPAGGACFEVLKELAVERDRNFGRGGGGGRGGRGGGGGGYRGGGGRGGSFRRNDSFGGQRGRGPSNYHGGNRRSSHEGRFSRDNRQEGGGYRGRSEGGGYSGRSEGGGYRGRSEGGRSQGGGYNRRSEDGGGYNRRNTGGRGGGGGSGSGGSYRDNNNSGW